MIAQLAPPADVRRDRQRFVLDQRAQQRAGRPIGRGLNDLGGELGAALRSAREVELEALVDRALAQRLVVCRA